MTEGNRRESPPLCSAMMGVRRKKKNGEAMFCGWRKMVGGAMLARLSKMAGDAMLARLVVVCDVAGVVWWRLVVVQNNER